MRQLDVKVATENEDIVSTVQFILHDRTRNYD